MNRRRAFWLAVCAVIALSLVWHSWGSAFDHDEVEHLHAAWLISQGELPFRDFLEQHHPTLWYALVPVTAAISSPRSIVFAARILDLANLAVFLFLFAALVRLVYPSISARWPMLLLVASFTFTRNMVEIRPDPVMNTFTFAGLVLWLAFLNDGRWWRAVLAGLCFGMAMAVLQKAMVVFGLVVLASVITGVIPACFKHALECRNRGRESSHSIIGAALMLISSTLPLAGLFLNMFHSGIFDGFYFWNYTFNKFFYLNADIEAQFSILKTVWNGFVRNPVLWIFGIVGASIVMKKIFTDRKTDGNWQGKFITAVVAIGYFLLLAGSRMPFDQYLIVFLPFMALASAEVFERLRAHGMGAIYKVATVLMAALFVIILLAYPSNARQRAVQDYVLEHTMPGDTVAISPPYHPIVRRDGTYFWYNGAFIGKTYAELCVSGGCNGSAIERDRAMWKENAPVFVYLDPEFKKSWPYRWSENADGYKPAGLDGLMCLK